MKWLGLVVLAACGHPHAGHAPDAAGAPDGDAVDAASALDAIPGASDAMRGSPDAAVDTTGSAVTGGPCESGAAGQTLLRARFDQNAHGDVVVVYEEIGTPDNAGLVGIYGYNVGFTPTYNDGLVLDSHDFVDVSTSTAAITHLTSVTLSVHAIGEGGPSGFSWQSPAASGQTAQYAIGSAAPAWYSEDATPLFAAGDAHASVRVKTLASDNAIGVAKLELCVVAN
jgi:hypothetical protein